MSGRAALQRILAALGLVLMVPIAVQLLQGALTAPDAAVRAVTLLVGVAVARTVLVSIRGRPEIMTGGPAKIEGEAGPLTVDATVTTGRRRTDRVPEDGVSLG